MGLGWLLLESRLLEHSRKAKRSADNDAPGIFVAIRCPNSEPVSFTLSGTEMIPTE